MRRFVDCLSTLALVLTGASTLLAQPVPAPCDLPRPFIAEVLVTPSIASMPGCNVTSDQIAGDWITGSTSGGDAYTDADIVPSEGLQILPDFAVGAPLSNGWAVNHGPNAVARFFSDPADPANSLGILNRATAAGDGLYDWQRADIYEADINDTMNVAFFYAINPTDQVDIAWMGFGTDDGGGVRCNGKVALAHQACRGDPGYADKFQVALKPGKNLISVYTFESGGGYTMRIRFEDGKGNARLISTTLDPLGYVFDPNAPTPPPAQFPFVSELLVTPSISTIPGCNVTPDQIAGDWITGTTSGGDDYTDASIVPSEDLEILPDWAVGAPLSNGWALNHGPNAADKFFTDPVDPANSSGILNRVTSGDGFYDWQRGDIYEADINDTMNVAFCYAINEQATNQTVWMGFGSDDGGGVRVNGKVALAMQACRGDPGFADKFQVVLKPGKNLVSVYTFESGGGYNMRLRFEDETGTGILIPTTLDPAGYVFDPNAPDHPVPPNAFVPEVLVGPSISAPPGCNVTRDQIMDDWITGGDDQGNVYTDADIVPSEGMQILPDFNVGAPLSTGWATNHGPNATERFFSDPTDPAFSFGILNVATSANGFYDWQRGDIYEADIDNTMNVAFFYAINPDPTVKELQMGFGSDDGGGVRVNGKVAHAIQACRGDPGYADKFRVALKPGKNLISVYTFESGGGYNMRIRFEERGTGRPLVVETTLDPTGYTFDPNAPTPGSLDVGNPSPLGLVTKFLVPQHPLDQSLGCVTNSLASADDYISIDGDAPSHSNVVEGAAVGGGVGLSPITTGARNPDGSGVTELVVFDGGASPTASTDPGLFDGEVFYGNPDNYTGNLFFFVGNKTASPKTVYFAFASDDAASLYLNGELIGENMICRGFGAANSIQDGFFAAELAPNSSNLVQLSYNEGGGGSGARVGIFGNCAGTAFVDPAEIVLDIKPITTGGGGENWIRGDANGDKLLDISDAVANLGYQFLGDAPPECIPALDFNGDGPTDISDPVGFLGVLFLGNPLPSTWMQCEEFAGCRDNCP